MQRDWYRLLANALSLPVIVSFVLLLFYVHDVVIIEQNSLVGHALYMTPVVLIMVILTSSSIAIEIYLAKLAREVTQSLSPVTQLKDFLSRISFGLVIVSGAFLFGALAVYYQLALRDFLLLTNHFSLRKQLATFALFDSCAFVLLCVINIFVTVGKLRRYG